MKAQDNEIAQGSPHRIKKVHDKNVPKEMKFIRYILNDKTRGFPRITIMVGKLNGIACRGLALCSLSETREVGFIESEGTELARHRMLKAFNRAENSEEINRTEAFRVIAACIKAPVLKSTIPNYLKYKSAHNVRITHYEASLFKEL